MMNKGLAARNRAMPAPSAPNPDPGIASRHSGTSGELRLPLAMWIYVARGMGRIILSVLALPFV
jgi:hypothetical protein